VDRSPGGGRNVGVPVHAPRRIAAALAIAAFAAGLFAGSALERGDTAIAARSSPAAGAQGCPEGTWIHSQTAAWLRRVVEVAGYAVPGCTGSAWIATTRRTGFYIWSTERWRRSPEFKPYTGAAPLPLPTYTDGRRIVWQAQRLGIWVEPGPSPSDVLPGKTALAWLQVTSRGLPRRYRPIEMMPTPPAVLARCRSDARLHPACPARIPLIEGWETYPRRVNGIFGIQLGGEIPGKPELMRPPRVLHIEVAVRPDRWVPFRWPTSGAVRPHNGLVRTERPRPVFLGEVEWGGKRGSVALAPGYPFGGSQGNHVIFRWRRRGETYVVALHAWEPFSEAYATLRRVVASLSRR
jgi:hypothetical protein